MDYVALLNMIGDAEYMLMDIPSSVVVQSVKLDKRGIEIILTCGIDDFAEDNSLEVVDELFPAEDDLPACLVCLATSNKYPVRVWQFDEIWEDPTK